ASQVSAHLLNASGSGRTYPPRSTRTSRSRSSASACFRVTPSRSAPIVCMTCFPWASVNLTRQTTPRAPSYLMTPLPAGIIGSFQRRGRPPQRLGRCPEAHAHIRKTYRGCGPLITPPPQYTPRRSWPHLPERDRPAGLFARLDPCVDVVEVIPPV